MKKILITGASRGIGFETAIKLSNLGHHVYAIARSKDRLDDLSTKVTAGKITSIVSDISSEEGVNLVLTKLKGVSGIDILINNAGLLINKPFMETSIEDWNAQLNVNLLAPVLLIKSLKQRLSKNSHIVNISSMGGFQGASKFVGLSAYSSSKGALSILTECLSAEFEKDSIAVNCLCLGAVQTEMLDAAFPDYKAPTKASEIADFISNFALKANQFLNGRVLPIALNNPE